MKKLLKAVILLMIAGSSLVFAEGQVESSTSYQQPTKEAKNVILLIGDGMSATQVAATDAYLGSKDNNYMDKLSFENFADQAMTTTYAGDRLITDSAAAGTALATGSKTYCGAISVDMDRNNLKTLVEYAQDKGKATGVITSTRVTHATPAVFISHDENRDNEVEIANDEAVSGVDFLAGGGYRYFINGDRGLKTKRKDGRDLITEMEANGYKSFISESDTQSFLDYTPKAGDKVVGLFGYSHLDYDIDRTNQPSLADMTEKGIELLSKDSDGFFMMVEGGRIDHACHANDGVSAIYDTLAFNAAVEKAIEFYNENPEDTLVIVTGDHETGGMTLGFAGTYYESAFDSLKNQKISYENYQYGAFQDYKDSHNVNNAKLADLQGDLSNYFGLTDLNDQEATQLQTALIRSISGEEVVSNVTDDYLLYGGYEPFIMEITHILNNRAGLGWTTYSHTAVPVLTYAKGPSSEMVSGSMDNTDVFNICLSSMGLSK